MSLGGDRDGDDCAPVPALLLCILVQLAVVPMCVAVGFNNPMVVMDALVIVPAHLVVARGSEMAKSTS
jgi:hypothetical protein